MVELTREERGRRVLGVIYSLSGGSTKVLVQVGDILAECQRLRLFEMTAEEFEDYRRKSVEDAHVLDAGVVGD